MKSNIYMKLATVFSIILMFSYAATSQSIQVPVADAADDAEEFLQGNVHDTDPEGYMDITSSDLELCNAYEGMQQLVGIIFRNVQIPAGSTITNAYIQFCVDDDNAEAITLSIWGAKAATVTAPWTDALHSISTLTKTTAKVSWTPPAWTVEEETAHAMGPGQQTPDISSIIQEIIGIEGWASGNNICILLMDESGTVQQHREAESFDGASDDHAGVGIPTLNVAFTAGTAVDLVQDGLSGVFPNPTEGMLNIANPSRDQFSFEIYSIDGKLLARRMNVSGETARFDMSGLAKGVYFVDVKSPEKSQTHKVILK